MEFKVTRIASTMESILGSRHSWGEAWWTARDICFGNPVQLPDPLQALMDEFERREIEMILFGDGSTMEKIMGEDI